MTAPIRAGSYPNGWHDWYDWALVYRYWTGKAKGLRKPYLLEIKALLELGAQCTDKGLAERLGMPERTIARWRANYREAAT